MSHVGSGRRSRLFHLGAQQAESTSQGGQSKATLPSPQAQKVTGKSLSAPPSSIAAQTKNEIREHVAEDSPLAKIGEPDFSGWLRKKGQKYNTWKLRYLILKGVYLYYLKSQNVSNALEEFIVVFS
jgi:hypothetical protein